jgi:hypothetical protein
MPDYDDHQFQSTSLAFICRLLVPGCRLQFFQRIIYVRPFFGIQDLIWIAHFGPNLEKALNIGGRSCRRMRRLLNRFEIVDSSRRLCWWNLHKKGDKSTIVLNLALPWFLRPFRHYFQILYLVVPLATRVGRLAATQGFLAAAESTPPPWVGHLTNLVQMQNHRGKIHWPIVGRN